MTVAVAEPVADPVDGTGMLLLLVLLHAGADDGAVAVGVNVVVDDDLVGAFDVAVGVRVGAVAGVGDCFGAFDGAGKLQGVYF